MTCEVFSFHSNTLNSIYSQDKDNRSRYFSGQLEDDYKVVIEASSVGFQQSASLLDIGYQSEELEARKILRDPSDPPELEDECRVYENRKLLNSVNPTLYISSLGKENGVQIIKSINKSETKNVMRLMYNISMTPHAGHIGKAYAYLDYDSTTESLEITSASVDFDLKRISK